MILGAHESIAGGPSKAFGRAREHGAEALQIFVKNARGWKAKPLDPSEVAAFRAEARSTGLPVMAHASYLINLAAPAGSELREKSLDAFVDELDRCEALGIPGLVIHPGSCADHDEGIELIAEAIDAALARVPGQVQVWLENTAGQGTAIAADFRELGRIFAASGTKERLGVCFDTCHAFAAGYDLTNEAGYASTFASLEEAIGGLQRVRGFHLNDCKKPLGCRVDRHEEIGDGAMGLLPFRLLLGDERFTGAIGVLETPEPERYPENLRKLRALV
ncbi:deoxyribonuclease IV [Vulgatibacter sp.]|uniref:deoxyribonuclease IV n=1 Tax=Vulgatibacter sp. TaxID=1971226 RepID=UPI003569CF3A